MRLERAALEDFDLIYSEKEKNFVSEERRDHEFAFQIMSEPNYTVYHVIDGETKVGFITVWDLVAFAYIEHFVIYELYRNLGYGGRTLEILKKMYKSMVLEAEPPTDELRSRRIAFYERNGFFKNDYPYIQPPYRRGETRVPLVLMSYPSTLENCKKTADAIYYGIIHGETEK